MRHAGRFYSLALAIASLLAFTSFTHAQVLNENFDAVTGVGGEVFFLGQGAGGTDDFDTGITGENAYGGTFGTARTSGVIAEGATGIGVAGSGAVVVDIGTISFDLVNETFNAVTETTDAVFLTGDGITPDTDGFTPSIDDGAAGAAFGGTRDGAILIGTMTAEGIANAGVGSSGAASLSVDDVDITSGTWFAGLTFPIPAFPGSTPLNNPSFEDEGGSLAGWDIFSAGFNVIAETVNATNNIITPRTGDWECKMFGQFNGSDNESGIYQTLPAEPGQVWEIDAFSRNNSDDPILPGSNFMTMRIEFFDSDSNVIGTPDEVLILDGNSPLDTWIDNPPLQSTAPANTVSVRPVWTFNQIGFDGGAGHLDDLRFKLVSGQSTIDLSTIGFTADIQGAADMMAGEMLGDYELRLEDQDGNRLRFNGTTTGAYQNVGGFLDTATEADADGNPASGVFDVNSPSFTAVVAFDNEGMAGPSWGTGGTLNVDNVVVSNDNSEGSGWFGGLFWDNLVPSTFDINQLTLSADILGDVVGGAYQLRLEAFQSFIAAGLDIDFENVVDTTEVVFLDTAAIAGGQFFSTTPGWSPDINGEQAFAGISNIGDPMLVDTVSFTPRFYARGINNTVTPDGGGCDGSMGAGEIVVESISIPATANWFAGLNWPGQRLPSTDLADATLTACVRGLTDPSEPFGPGVELLGNYELRFEDPDGDRLYFPMTADGTWQQVGGLLSEATFGTALDGDSNGVFDIDFQNPSSITYSVVVSFIDPATTWFSGGRLQVDNVFLTPAQGQREIGRISFDAVADGTFQSVGGALSTANSTFEGDYVQDFSGASYVFVDPNDWDTGLEGEFSFAGAGNGAVLNDTVVAEACMTCGADNGPGAQVDIRNVSVNGGTWFAGANFSNIGADLTGDLSEIILSADVRGTVDEPGEILGEILFRIEDSDLTALQFSVMADGTYQSIGGPLSDAQLVQINQGDGFFDTTQATYTITIVVDGNETNWGAGGTISFDNFFLTGIDLSSADVVSVTAAFADEIDTWGTEASLTVDNLVFGLSAADPLGDMNCDGNVDLNDVGPFVQALLDPTGYASAFPACNIDNGDTNDDNAVNGTDVQSFIGLLLP